MKRALNWAGGALALGGLAFVAVRLQASASELDLGRFREGSWTVLAVLAAVHGLANLLLTEAWRQLLERLGSRITFRVAFRLHGVSQLGRYLPGNVFHLASRQALGMAAGLPGTVLAKSAAAELVVITLAGALFGALALPLVWRQLPLLAGAGSFLLLVVVAAAVSHGRLGAPTARAFAWHIAFLAASAAVFVGTLGVVLPTPVGAATWPAVGGAYVIAWLAGLLTPGAPAGLGIRESVLLFLLGGTFAQADLVLAVVIGRLVTVLGDLGYFAAALGTPPAGRAAAG